MGKIGKGNKEKIKSKSTSKGAKKTSPKRSVPTGGHKPSRVGNKNKKSDRV